MRKVIFISTIQVCALITGFALLAASAKPDTSSPSAFAPTEGVVDAPIEIAPDTSYTWPGTKQEPKKLRIPRISIEGYIEKVGIDNQNNVAAPQNIHIAGWFDQSVPPGDVGLSIIDGHVDGLRYDGIFKNLGSLQPGDEIYIEFGDGAIRRFLVTKSREVPTESAVDELFSQDPSISQQLNLITCGGTFDSKTRSYSNRIIVSAKLVT